MVVFRGTNSSTSSTRRRSHQYVPVSFNLAAYSILNLSPFSMARLHTKLYPRITKFRQYGRFRCCDQYRYNWAVYVLRYMFLRFDYKSSAHCMQGIPIALRVIYRDDFVKGPFHLGKFSYPIAIGAVTWIGFISIAFILPQVNVSM